MKIKNKIIILLSVLMVFLTGCTRQEYNVSINDNNSVDLTIKVLISKESYNLISTFGIDINELEENKQVDTGTEIDKINALFQETAMMFHEYGFNITTLDDAVEIGFKAEKSYLTIDEFNTEIKKLCDNNLCGLNLDIQHTDKTNLQEYKAYGTLDYLIDKDMGLSDETIKTYFDEQYDTSNMTAVAYINMPLSTPITNHDGVESNNGISWETSYSEGQKEVHIISLLKDNTTFYIIGVVSFVILLVVGFFIIRALKFKKEKENSALSDEYEEERENNA